MCFRAAVVGVRARATSVLGMPVPDGSGAQVFLYTHVRFMPAVFRLKFCNQMTGCILDFA
jgi:hypothetical protein